MKEGGTMQHTGCRSPLRGWGRGATVIARHIAIYLTNITISRSERDEDDT
jgi:hypothetical protein